MLVTWLIPTALYTNNNNYNNWELGLWWDIRFFNLIEWLKNYGDSVHKGITAKACNYNSVPLMVQKTLVSKSHNYEQSIHLNSNTPFNKLSVLLHIGFEWEKKKKKTYSLVLNEETILIQWFKIFLIRKVKEMKAQSHMC